MDINTTPATRLLFDYEFTFTSGLFMSFTIDPEAGDEINLDHNPAEARVYLAPKPSLSNPNQILPADELLIFKSHIVAIRKIQKELTPMTPEQREEWNKTLKDSFKVVH